MSVEIVKQVVESIKKISTIQIEKCSRSLEKHRYVAICQFECEHPPVFLYVLPDFYDTNMLMQAYSPLMARVDVALNATTRRGPLVISGTLATPKEKKHICAMPSMSSDSLRKMLLNSRTRPGPTADAPFALALVVVPLARPADDRLGVLVEVEDALHLSLELATALNASDYRAPFEQTTMDVVKGRNVLAYERLNHPWTMYLNTLEQMQLEATFSNNSGNAFSSIGANETISTILSSALSIGDFLSKIK
ncbi:hypothetical protein EJ03DRAFT_355656 [Teratosphaeria nubilosa]|uniref:Uncharacterized protein n=1 Tax=Teratosphaeria nubilosa TaxID=161662 RepID=A0A6G1KVA7_9PEZI|nr:hypothetical protein EJ03DRAFT_355656 [Teratosphaeria nubilosa]